DITVHDLLTHRGDVHHIFPKNYLKRNGYTKSRYNQIANYVMMQSEINIAIGDKPPAVYFNELVEQCKNGKLQYGGIDDLQQLEKNLKANCIPMQAPEIKDYEAFLLTRRKLMALKIRDYYFSL
ncbi:MAG: hypothetical protein ACE5I1_18340, partial [bacterium]